MFAEIRGRRSDGEAREAANERHATATSVPLLAKENDLYLFVQVEASDGMEFNV